MDKCCLDAGESRFREEYPSGSSFGDLYMQNYLLSSIKKTHSTIEVLARAFIVKIVDDASLGANARVLRLLCKKNHERLLIILGTRFCLFTWRSNMVLANYWDTQVDPQGRLYLVPKKQRGPWPSPKLVNQLERAVRLYFSKDDISKEDFNEFNKIVLSSHRRVASMYAFIVELAELFVLLHEFMHHAPPPDKFRMLIKPSGELNIPESRRKQWLKEVQADVDSFTWLYISTCRYFIEKGYPILDARKSALSLVFSATDAVIDTILLLERIKYGPNSLEQATTDWNHRTHPPAIFRRYVFGHMSKKFALSMLPKPAEAHWLDIRNSVASLNHVRGQLFETFIGEFQI